LKCCHDIVIHTATGMHTSSAIALIRGLALRKKETGKEMCYIHTSGTSHLGDKSISGGYLEPRSRVFSDEEDIYSYLKKREAVEIYAQRTTDIAVVETGKETGVKTHILMSPTIYGFCPGAYNIQSIQIPTLMRSALKLGHAEVIGEGAGEWDHVHIADMANLYELFLTKILEGADVPFGEKGIFFSGTGRGSWYDVASKAGKAGFELGVLDTAEPKSITLAVAARWFGR
jgi:nucleoside-diphosphate-sugar epimerase